MGPRDPYTPVSPPLVHVPCEGAPAARVSAAGAPRTRSDAGAPRSRSAACRSILDSVSAEVLREIAADHLDLVCGSTAIHERDGAVAMGIVTSGWCQLLREASRQPAGDHRCASTPASTLRRCPEAC